MEDGLEVPDPLGVPQHRRLLPAQLSGQRVDVLLQLSTGETSTLTQNEFRMAVTSCVWILG